MTAADGLSLLAQQEIADGTSFSAELTSDRFLATVALPEVDYPFAVNASTGLSTCAGGTASGNVLTYLAHTDGDYAAAKAQLESTEILRKRVRARHFLTSDGSVAERNAEAETHDEVEAADDAYIKALTEFEKLKAHRQRRALHGTPWWVRGSCVRRRRLRGAFHDAAATGPEQQSQQR
jgi:hypothetical protein